MLDGLSKAGLPDDLLKGRPAEFSTVQPNRGASFTWGGEVGIGSDGSVRLILSILLTETDMRMFLIGSHSS